MGSTVLRESIRWPAVVLTLLALAVTYGVGSTFFTIELERRVERTLTPRLEASSSVAALSQEIYADAAGFMVSARVRPIGYACLALVVLLATVGLAVQKRGLALLGSLGTLLPVYAYFVLHMSFLAGLQVLTVLWAPFWGDLVRLGDVAYLPYAVMVYPFAWAGIDVRQHVTGLLAGLGLLIFILGVLGWFYARFRGKDVADFWIYRFSRHPQYLGWILWSYSLMLRVALRRDTPLGQVNPGASLPWVVSSLIIVCVALSEEMQMECRTGAAYERYRDSAPFLLPLPRFLSRLMSAPFRFAAGKARPENQWDLILTFGVYLAVAVALSVALILMDWPGVGG